MSEAKKPGGLLAQHKLLRAVIQSREWANLSDVETADIIIDRYFPKHGNSRVSLSYLEQATGGKRERIVGSIRRLVKHGVIAVVRKGAGTRPTEYSLNFDYTPNPLVVPQMGTSSPSELVVPQMGTSVVPQWGTTTAASSPQNGDLNLLTMPADKPAYVSNIINSPGSSPRVPGVPPVPARTPVGPKEGFEALWDAYGVKSKRADAKHAYDTLAPDPETHDEIIAAAQMWCDHYAATETDPRWRKRLANWIKGECWLEDLPATYEDPKEAAIARAKERGPRAAKGQGSSGTGSAPIGRHVAKIVNLGVVKDTVIFRYQIVGGKHDGTEFEHSFPHFNTHGNIPEATEMKRQIWAAAGRNLVKSEDPRGAVLAVTVGRGGSILKYEPHLGAHSAAA